ILARAGARARVVVLGNHGLVVGGADVATAEALLREVSARLGNAIGGSGSGHADPAPDPDLMARLEGSGWSPARHPAVHALARDPARCAIVDSGSLYPDHVIFLGPGVVVLRAGETPDAAAARLGGMSKLLLLPGQGAALRSDATAAQHAMARCLGDVAAQVAPGTVLTRLSPADEAALLNWDAEKYRQALEAAREAGK
ncbi:MAG: class II aldolase, partial [Pseudomonadota bacterium]